MKLETLGTLALMPSLACVTNLHAGSRTGGNYTVPADTVDSGGLRATSTAYTNDGTAGIVLGISTAPTQIMVRSGYVAQLGDVAGLALSASQSAVIEDTTIQLSASEVLDDNTSNPVSTGSVAWTVQNGPLAGISGGGLATAGNVIQNTLATVGGSRLGFQATFTLTVLNTGSDDFGSYAGDGLPDDWQVQWFGTDNPLAAPTADADGTGQNNLFKWVAGLNPLDGSRFAVSTLPAPVPGQPGKMWFSVSPVVAGRTYSPQFNDTLLPGNWQPLAGYLQADYGTTRVFTDIAAPGDHRFYRVVITLP